MTNFTVLTFVNERTDRKKQTEKAENHEDLKLYERKESEWTRMDQNGPEWTRMAEKGSARIF